MPCVAWTTAFFSKEVCSALGPEAGRAAYFSTPVDCWNSECHLCRLGKRGWRVSQVAPLTTPTLTAPFLDSATYAIMVSLFHKFRETKSVHTSWRLSFVAVPVPVLILTAILVIVFGTDCPTGAWSTRHTTNATAAAVMAGHEVKLDSSEQRTIMNKKQEPSTTVQEVSADDEEEYRGDERPVGVTDNTVVRSDVDVAVNEPLTMKALGNMFKNPLTWLPSLAYMTTFGFELAVDSILANVILRYHPTIGMEKAGYYASIFGLLNIITRPLGGILADLMYRKYGVGSKKYFTLGLGIGQGVLTIGFGMLLKNQAHPGLGAMMGIIVCIAFCNEMANGANFALVSLPHEVARLNSPVLVLRFLTATRSTTER